MSPWPKRKPKNLDILRKDVDPRGNPLGPLSWPMHRFQETARRHRERKKWEVAKAVKDRERQKG